MTYEDIFKSTGFSLKECFFIIVLLLTELGLRCCAGFSPVAVNGGYSLVDVWGLLVAGASLVAEHGPRVFSFSSCSAWTPSWWLPGYRAQAQ